MKRLPSDSSVILACKKTGSKTLILILSATFMLASLAPESLYGQQKAPAQKTQNFKVVPGAQNRVIGHQEAYTKRNIVGGHMNVKITPPERHGKSGKVAVEVYNYSPYYLSLVNFWMELETKAMYKIDAQIKVENLKQNWGDIVWIQIPPKFVKDFPELTGVKITALKMYDDKARQIIIPVTTDLIKN